MHRTMLFLDTEFTGLTQDAKLLSLALYRSDDTYFYAEFNDYNATDINEWVQAHVIGHFLFQHTGEYFRQEGHKVQCKGNTAEVSIHLSSWLGNFEAVQICADVSHYDWVLFCELFGGARNIPPSIHYICLDLATCFMVKGLDPDTDRETFLNEHHFAPVGKRHNALDDAKMCAACYSILTEKRD